MLLSRPRRATNCRAVLPLLLLLLYTCFCWILLYQISTVELAMPLHVLLPL